MASEIKMPASGQTSAESVITNWHVKEGDYVERGDVLFEIETDKASLNIESFAKGVVLKIFYEEGDLVESGEVVAIIGEENEEVVEEINDDEYQPILNNPDEHNELDVNLDSIKEASATNMLASPAAKKLARDNDINLNEIFGKTEKIIKIADVKNFLEAKDGVGYETVKLTKMRKVIADRMLDSTKNVPQFTITVKVNMEKMIALRNSFNELLKEENLKISFNDLLCKCICNAVKEVPYINSQFFDNEIRLSKSINIGIAVGLSEGLIVPVIKNVERLSLREIAIKNQQIIQDARNIVVGEDNSDGGTITISNLGMYGISNFTAIINRPESSILAVGSIIETPVCSNGNIISKPIMDITATFDHRVIDGSVGALFMKKLKENIENPLSMLL